MNCPNCGTEATQGEMFCAECGAQITQADTTLVTQKTQQTETETGLTPGTTLQNGRYVITKMLGEGGMGSVMLAKDTRLADKLMVVKALSADNSNTQKLHDDVRNFKHEAETLAHLDHPLVPDVTDHFEEGAHYYMVMDYVEGENLEHWLDRTNQPMQEQDALKYTLEVLDILEYLSQRQPPIVHRDIKPANIIISSKDKHAHLVDFGIARSNLLVNGQRRQTTALGTPGYAPPEQYQGYADERSDLYALAATLHHLVTNRDPGDNAPFQFPPIRTLNARLSPQLEEILEKALKTSPSERYQTAQEMRQEIESLLAGTSTIGMTDSYRLSDSTTLRALPPKPSSPKKSEAFDLPASSFAESTQRSSTRTRQRQQQQMEEPSYYDPEAYQQEAPQPAARSFYEPPRRLRSFPPQQSSYNYNNRQQIDENQLMWRFIFFVVVVCIIALLAYVLFSSLRLY